MLAAVCYATASRTGLRIGVDLAVTGFDGSAIGRILTPALTTVAMPLAEVADRLVDRIVSEVSGVSDERGEVLATTLIWGESVFTRASRQRGAARAAQRRGVGCRDGPGVAGQTRGWFAP